MKKITVGFFLCLLICKSNLFAQDQFGVAVMPVLSHALRVDNTVIPKYPLLFGIRGEVMKTKLGIHRFHFAYIGLAATYFPYPKENVTVHAFLRDSVGGKDFTGTLKQAQIDGMLKVGFEIPQHWDEFLYLNIGIGGGLLKGKRTYQLDGFDEQKYALPTSDNGNLVEKGSQYLSEFFLSGFYEREKFYFFSQLELISGYGTFNYETMNLRVNAGIYYTFGKTDK